MILVQEVLSTHFSSTLLKLMENNSKLEDIQHGILPTNRNATTLSFCQWKTPLL